MNLVPSEISQISPDNNSNANRVRKSRNRIPASCSVCRKKKIRCDKIKPICGGCTRSQSSSSCSYENQPWEVATDSKRLNQHIVQLKQQNAELKSLVSLYELQINELISNRAIPNELPNIFMNDGDSFRPKTVDHVVPQYSNSRNNNKDEEDDEILDLVKDFDVLVIKENKLLHFGSTSFMALASNDPIIREMFGKIMNCHKEIYKRMHKSPLAGEEIEDTLLSARTASSLSDIIDPINDILPPKDIFDALMDRFFEKCYSFMPYLDKDMFLSDLNVVMKSGSNNTCFFIVPSLFFLPRVAIALILLRFSYLTILTDFSDKVNSKKYDYLSVEMHMRKVAIGPSFAEHAKNCILNSAAVRKSNLQIVQALLFMKFYKAQSPEDGDAGIDSIVSLSIIIQMAKVIGLNRDPSNFNLVHDERVRHVWRKVWYKLMEIDAERSLTFGQQLLIDNDSFDTELPHISNELQKAGNINPAEPSVMKFIALQFQTVTLFRKVSKIMMVVKTNPKRSAIESCVIQLEDLMQYKLRPFREFMKVGASVYRYSFTERSEMAKEFCLRLDVAVTHHILNYILLLTTVPDNLKLRDKYSCKAIKSALVIFKYCFDFFKHPEMIFGNSVKRLLIPTLLNAVQRAFQLICILIIRHYRMIVDCFNGGIESNFANEDTEDLMRWLTHNKQEISKVSGIDINDSGKLMSFQLYVYMEQMFTYISPFCDEYLHAWKFCKVMKIFIAYLVEKHPIYKEFSNGWHSRHSDVSTEIENKVPDQAELNSFSQEDYNLVQTPQNYQKYVDYQLSKMSVFSESKMSEQWFNLIDEAGQSKLDFFTPLFDFNEDKPSDLADAQNSNQHQFGDNGITGKFDTSQLDSVLLNNTGSLSSGLTPNGMGDLPDFNTEAFLNDPALDEQLKNVNQLLGSNQSEPLYLTNASTNSNFGEHGEYNESTPSASTSSNNGPSPSEVLANYGNNLVKMMFGET